jgi:dTDP-4-dehydrorhamnose 3,5-epimerase
MKLIKTDIPEVVVIEPDVFGDERGYFMETYRKDKLNEFLGYEVHFCQDNESKSSFGVLRGLHFQLPPAAQSKLVRVIKGRVFDVAVDIRKGSPTFGKYVGVELSGENKRQMFVPRGFAHGFLVLSKEAVFTYKVDNYYSPENDRGIAYNDSTIGIDWGIPDMDLNLSAKDLKQPALKGLTELFDYSVNYYE